MRNTPVEYVQWHGDTDTVGYKPRDVCMRTLHHAQLAYKLEVQKLVQDASQFTISALNYCKLTAATTAKDGGVQKHYRVFAKQKLEVQKLARMPVNLQYLYSKLL